MKIALLMFGGVLLYLGLSGRYRNFYNPSWSGGGTGGGGGSGGGGGGVG